MRLYTLGTGRRPPYEFTRILYKFGIQVLFDIRSHPTATSDNLAHFSRAALERLCAENKINYLYLGNELRAPQQSAVKEWIESEEFHRGVKIIISKIPTRVSCLLCSCYTPEHCHRLIIANEIARCGILPDSRIGSLNSPGQKIEVVHILEENRFWSPGSRRFNRKR
ncbi:MAG: DUF488 domain-containing protein [candidate division WOR-3 bacterium]